MNKIIRTIMILLCVSFFLAACHSKVNNNSDGELANCSASDKNPEENCLESIFNKWFESHITKDYNGMRAFYSDSVVYFGELYESNELIDYMRDYLSNNNYALRAEDVNVTLLGGPNAVVIFNRIIDDNFPPLPTVLRFIKENNDWKIIKEYPIL